MKIRLKADSYSYVGVMAIALVVIVLGLRMTYFESKLLPLLLGSAMLILAMAGLWRDIRAQGKAGAVTAKEPETDRSEQRAGVWRGYWLALSWVAGFVLTIFIFGYLIATPLYVFSYMKAHKQRWLTIIICTLATLPIIYFGFQVALNVELYPGVLFLWLQRWVF